MIKNRFKDRYYSLFVWFVLLIFVLSGAAVFIFAKDRGDLYLSGIFAAGVMNVLNSLIGFRLILKSLEQNDTKRFFVASLGSMSVRLFAILIFVLIGLMIFNFNKISFIFALFCYYFTFLILETIFLVKRINDRKRV